MRLGRFGFGVGHMEVPGRGCEGIAIFVNFFSPGGGGGGRFGFGFGQGSL